MLLGHARGKVGDLVFSRVNGQQVTRARAAVVKNPQTEAQMIQRILLNTVIQAYSRMSEICDHSFEGIAQGQPSMSAFMKRNLALLRQYVSDGVNIEGHTFGDLYAFSPIGSNEFTMNPFVIAAGSLPSVTIADISALNGAKIAVTAAAAALTYDDVITSLGLQRGDQLTFISQEAWTDRRAAFNFARVILDPRDADGNQLPLTTEFLKGTAINMPNPRNEGSEINYSFADGYLTFNRSDNSQFGAAVIVSRQKADGTWLRSNTSITQVAGTAQLVNSRSLQECLDLFAAGSIDVANPLYLNNARRVTGSSVRTAEGFAATYGYVPVGANFDTGKVSGTVNLVAVRQGEVDGVPAVLVTSDQGQDYALYSDNTSASHYGGYLKSMTGNLTNAWTPINTKESPTNTLSVPMIEVFDRKQDLQVNDFVLWLQEKGVDISVFVNKE